MNAVDLAASEYLDAASALVERRRFDEADQLLQEAGKRFSDDPTVKAAYANAAVARRDWEEACRRWEWACSAHPSMSSWFASWANILVHIGRTAEAERILIESIRDFPSDSELLQIYARAAERAGDWNVALLRWKQFREAFQTHPAGYFGALETLRQAGRFEEAESLMNAASEDVIGHPMCMYQLAKNATAGRKWQVAYERWALLLSKFPTLDGADTGLGELIALWHLACAEGDVEARSVVIPSALAKRVESRSSNARDDAGSSYRDLMFEFESLGDHCEFGLVQRHFGAEPLSLLRWSAISPENLADALDKRFEGVGDPENTYVKLNDREYFAGDHRWFFMHTFIRASESSEQDVLKTSRKRLSFLRTRLLENLDEGRKIFIYKRHVHKITDEQCALLFKAVRERYPNAVFCIVRLADTSHPPGNIEKLSARQFVGYLDRSNDNLSHKHISYDCWRSICQRLAEIANADHILNTAK
jgi:Flp pilus assembly protein TadD